MADLHPFEHRLAADWPPENWTGVTVLVAVSGGADSVALLRSLIRLRDAQLQPGEGRLVVAHFNHRWRGVDSDRDARFVRTLATELGAEVVVGRPRKRAASADLQTQNRSEEAARKLRYRFLTEVADRCGARYLAMAHTADDQSETVLQRVLRGTGIAGLAGIPRIRRLAWASTLIRPMLSLTRGQVLEYLSSLDQNYREDSTNATCDYTRNRIRHEVLPLARQLYGDVDGALRRLSSLSAEASEILTERAHFLAEESLVGRSSDSLTLRTPPLAAAKPYLRREALRVLWRRQDWPCQSMGSKEWDALAALTSASGAASRTLAATFPGNVSAKKQGELLTLTRPVK